MSVLSLSNVSVFNPANAAQKLVDSASCEINAGEILTIIGPNGAGKSSLLKAISGEWNYQGTISAPQLETEQKLRARQFALLPQFSLLNFPYTVSEVVKLGRIPHQTGHANDAQIVGQALELMDIEYLKDRFYTELSGGEKQRVQLARVLSQIWNAEDAPNGVRLLLLDEPTTALDLGHQHALMRAVRTFSQQNIAVVMVLHDINLAARYATKMLALLCSQTIAYGSPAEVVTAANMQRLFNVDVEIMQHPKSHTPMVVSR